jgi:hypothetical protein
MNDNWVAHDIRDAIMDFIAHWSELDVEIILQRGLFGFSAAA